MKLIQDFRGSAVNVPALTFLEDDEWYTKVILQREFILIYRAKAVKPEIPDHSLGLGRPKIEVGRIRYETEGEWTGEERAELAFLDCRANPETSLPRLKAMCRPTSQVSS